MHLVIPVADVQEAGLGLLELSLLVVGVPMPPTPQPQDGLVLARKIRRLLRLDRPWERSKKASA
jgi:hypothetical protein